MVAAVAHIRTDRPSVRSTSSIQRALSVRQPYAELILRGEKTIEWRSRPTRVVGERFYLYASLKLAGDAGIWSDDLADPEADALPWIRELGLARRLFGDGGDLPRGLLVGSATIERVIPPSGGHAMYGWKLAAIERLDRPRKPTGHPQPTWFRA